MPRDSIPRICDRRPRMRCGARSTLGARVSAAPWPNCPRCSRRASAARNGRDSCWPHCTGACSNALRPRRTLRANAPMSPLVPPLDGMDHGRPVRLSARVAPTETEIAWPCPTMKCAVMRRPPTALKDRVIVVTGAGGAIGAALARACAAHGARVVLSGRSVRKLEAVYDSIVAAGGAATVDRATRFREGRRDPLRRDGRGSGQGIRARSTGWRTSPACSATARPSSTTTYPPGSR